MTNTRNNLTPTVITDKNGKITTVHKKLPNGATRVLGASPVLVSQKTQTTRSEQEREEFLLFVKEHALMAPHLPADVVTANAEALQYKSPQTITLMNRLLGTGGGPSRRRVFKNITMILPTMFQEPRDYDNDAKSLEEILLSSWHASEITEELKLPNSEFAGISVQTNKHYHNFTKTSVRDEGEETSSARWRGAAIAAAITDSAPHPSFVPWASKQSDVPRVVKIAKQWETTNPETIETIMTQQDSIHAPLHDGIL